jgi:signal transduction histidine kinase
MSARIRRQDLADSAVRAPGPSASNCTLCVGSFFSPLVRVAARRHNLPMARPAAMILLLSLVTLVCLPVQGEILWNDPGSRVIHATPDGADILGGKLKRDDKASDVLYFRLNVDPLSDAANEPYYALLQLVESNQFRLGVGNALEAWGYSAAYTSETGPSNQVAGEFNLRSAHPEAAAMGVLRPYELPDHNHPRTIVFRVQYVPGGDDLVTAWLEPGLSYGATAENQPENVTTKFKANASFDEIRLRHEGSGKDRGGNGWIFSNMTIATSFDDFVVVRFWQTWWFFGLVALFVLSAVVITVRVVEKRKYQIQLKRAEQQHALEQERARIAQDLHDELGSLLTRISLLGNLLKVEKDNPEQIELHAGKIAQSADQTVRALEEIVWAIRPGSDSLQSLVEYLAHFANELFEDSPMRCRLDLQQDLPSRPLPPDVRHNIFLIAKEALTNALRHAHGGAVFVQVKAEGDHFKMSIADDGKGFDMNSPTADGQHNGLENMRRRTEAMGGQLSVTSERGKGTRMEFSVNFRS